MSIFAEVKEQVKPKQAAQYYIGKPAKEGSTNFYRSPFRNEKTPSFAVHDKKGLTDFGTGDHHDIISFVQKLYNLNPIESANKIISDFHLAVNEAQEITSVSAEAKAEKDEIERLARLLNDKLKAFFNTCTQKYKLMKRTEEAFQRLNIPLQNNYYRWIRQGVRFYDRATTEFIEGDYAKRVQLMRNHKDEYFFKLCPGGAAIE